MHPPPLQLAINFNESNCKKVNKMYRMHLKLTRKAKFLASCFAADLIFRFRTGEGASANSASVILKFPR